MSVRAGRPGPGSRLGITRAPGCRWRGGAGRRAAGPGGGAGAGRAGVPGSRGPGVRSPPISLLCFSLRSRLLPAFPAKNPTRVPGACGFGSRCPSGPAGFALRLHSSRAPPAPLCTSLDGRNLAPAGPTAQQGSQTLLERPLGSKAPPKPPPRTEGGTGRPSERRDPKGLKGAKQEGTGVHRRDLRVCACWGCHCACICVCRRWVLGCQCVFWGALYVLGCSGVNLGLALRDHSWRGLGNLIGCW